MEPYQSAVLEMFFEGLPDCMRTIPTNASLFNIYAHNLTSKETKIFHSLKDAVVSLLPGTAVQTVKKIKKKAYKGKDGSHWCFSTGGRLDYKSIEWGDRTHSVRSGPF